MADDDFTDPDRANKRVRQSPEGPVLRVPDPKSLRPPVEASESESAEGILKAERNEQAARALRVNNAWTSTELKKRNRELARLKLAVR